MKIYTDHDLYSENSTTGLFRSKFQGFFCFGAYSFSYYPSPTSRTLPLRISSKFLTWRRGNVLFAAILAAAGPHQ